MEGATWVKAWERAPPTVGGGEAEETGCGWSVEGGAGPGGWAGARKGEEPAGREAVRAPKSAAGRRP